MNHTDFMHNAITNSQAQHYNLKLILFPKYSYFIYFHTDPD